eukprot:749089-Hanusia_phi.AAC.1
MIGQGPLRLARGLGLGELTASSVSSAPPPARSPGPARPGYAPGPRWSRRDSAPIGPRCTAGNPGTIG